MLNLYFLILTIFLFFLSFFSYLRIVFFKEGNNWKIPFSLKLAVFSLTLTLIVRTLEAQHSPFAGVFESLPFYAWAIMIIYLFVAVIWKMEILGAFAIPLVLILLLISLIFLGGELKPLLPVLKSYWFEIHVISALLGYATFTLAAFSSILYFFQNYLLKRKRKLIGFFNNIPSLDTLDKVCYRFVVLGFPLFVLGIISGAIWAQNAWGSYWNWDPKESAALITCFFYAAYIHARMISGWQGKKVNLILLFAFISVIFTYFIVGILPGSHRY
ncbi:MAG: c-type cytochrome biogenesis protein CcsB [Armatimonadetes bacterium]|nr:c-type cytochrome biogenesis protein CcsB [Armatimonadota bacterium]